MPRAKKTTASEQNQNTETNASNAAPKDLLHKRLIRFEDDQIVSGVCSGIAYYLGDIDPTIVRVIFAVIALAGGGWTIPLYLIMWIVMPAGRKSEITANSK